MGDFFWNGRSREDLLRNDCAFDASRHALQCICDSETSQASAPQELTFADKYIWLIVLVLVSISLLVAIFVFDVCWRRVSQSRMDEAASSERQATLGRRVVQHFMPSMAVEAYQFSGMREAKVGISLQFNNIGLELTTGSIILQGVHGEFEEGKMTAILGPSGCGKSTFMNVLCGRATYGKTVGDMKVNSCKSNIDEIKKVIGFVPQDDVVHERLTVREQIQYSAELRNPIGTSRQRISGITNDVLHVLQIKHIQNSIVGGIEERGISGGQRKRVNIALELAACPVVLFLDEPTSGLDSTSSLMVINSLKKLTMLNMTIVMVIHQPRYSLFTLLDRVMLMGVGGRTAYLGPSEVAVPYFAHLGFNAPANDNPADWLMDVLSGEAEHPKGSGFARERLAEEWERKGVEFLEKVPTELVRRWSCTSAGAPRFSTAIDQRVVEHCFAEEWRKIDLNRDGCLDILEMKRLFERCLNETVPTSEVAHIMQVMAKNSKATKVTRQEAVDFLRAKCAEAALITQGPRTSVAGEQTMFGKVDGAIVDLLDVVVSMSLNAKENNPLERLRRRTPGPIKQFSIVSHRLLVGWWRHSRRRCIDLSMILACSLIVGFLHRDDVGGPANIVVYQLGLALLTAVSCLKAFADRPIFWRERDRGINVLAYHTAHVAVDSFDVGLQTVLYAMMYYLITQPEVAFEDCLIPSLLVAYAASGWGYLMSALIPPPSAMIATVLVMLILSGVLGNTSVQQAAIENGGAQEALVSTSLVRWSTQMFFLRYHEKMGGISISKPSTCSDRAGNSNVDDATAEQYIEDIAIARVNLKLASSYMQGPLTESFGYWHSGVFVLSLYGTLLRLLSYICLRHMQRGKHV